MVGGQSGCHQGWYALGRSSSNLVEGTKWLLPLCQTSHTVSPLLSHYAGVQGVHHDHHLWHQEVSFLFIQPQLPWWHLCFMPLGTLEVFSAMLYLRFDLLLQCLGCQKLFFPQPQHAESFAVQFFVRCVISGALGTARCCSIVYQGYGFLTPYTYRYKSMVTVSQLHFLKFFIQYIICTAFIRELQGQFTFVQFKEVAFKVPIREGTNEMVLYFSLNSCIISLSHIGQWAYIYTEPAHLPSIQYGTWSRSFNQGHSQSGVRNIFLIFCYCQVVWPCNSINVQQNLSVLAKELTILGLVSYQPAMHWLWHSVGKGVHCSMWGSSWIARHQGFTIS